MQAAKFGFGDQLAVPMRVTANSRSRPSSASRKRPSPPSASTTCASRRRRWPWSPQASPTGGRHEALTSCSRCFGLRSDDIRVRRAEHTRRRSALMSPPNSTMMTSVVASGTSTLPDGRITVAGKTGQPPARTGRGAPGRLVHLLRAGGRTPTVAVAVVVEEGRHLLATRHQSQCTAGPVMAIMEAVLR